MFGEHITLKKITTECFPNHFFSIGKQIRKKLTFRCHCCFPVKTCFTDNFIRTVQRGKKKKELAWRARRRGRTPPRAAWEPSHGVCRQATWPSQPATTFCPPTDSSISHLSGNICHITKHPFCCPEDAAPPVAEMSDPRSSTTAIITFPVVNIFLTRPSSFRQPVAATKCCKIYCAEEDT